MRQDEVEIIEREICYQGFYRLERLRLRHRLFAGGMGPPIVREVIEKGDVAAVLLYDPLRDEVVMIEQFRIGARDDARGPWLLEIVAGLIEAGETPAQVARREALEEAGCTVDQQLLHQPGEDLAAHPPLPRPGGQRERRRHPRTGRRRRGHPRRPPAGGRGLAARTTGEDGLGVAVACAVLVCRPARSGACALVARRRSAAGVRLIARRSQQPSRRLARSASRPRTASSQRSITRSKPDSAP